jgi:hypothetical protein
MAFFRKRDTWKTEKIDVKTHTISKDLTEQILSKMQQNAPFCVLLKNKFQTHLPLLVSRGLACMKNIYVNSTVRMFVVWVLSTSTCGSVDIDGIVDCLHNFMILNICLPSWLFAIMSDWIFFISTRSFQFSIFQALKSNAWRVSRLLLGFAFQVNMRTRYRLQTSWLCCLHIYSSYMPTLDHNVGLRFHSLLMNTPDVLVFRLHA